MKKTIFATLILFVLAITISSCGSAYKRRKTCKGNGSWYGNRNLGAVEQKVNQQDLYSLTASADK